jgi:hypothetical protein
MKRVLFIASLLSLALLINASGQSNQAPTIQQSTSTETNRQANPPRPKVKKSSPSDQMKRKTVLDSTLPGDRKQRQLRPDSLRRGGATRVDSVRR